MDDVQRAIDDQFKDVVDPDYENDVLKERVTVLQGGKYIMNSKKLRPKNLNFLACCGPNKVQANKKLVNLK